MTVGLFNRPDGVPATDVPPYRRIMPYIMRGRNESIVYFDQVLDLSKTLPFIRTYNEGMDQRITIFHVMLAALIRVLSERPRLNRFVAGCRVFQRNKIEISFAAKKRFDDESPLRTVKVAFEPEDTFERIVERILCAVSEGRSDKVSSVDKELGFILRLPKLVIKFLIRLLRVAEFFDIVPESFIRHDPMYASVFVANLGSLKIDAGFHHLYEYGNVSLFATLGRIEQIPVVNEDGAVTAMPSVRIKYSYDERVEDGLYCAKAIDVMRSLIENPEELLTESEKAALR